MCYSRYNSTVYVSQQIPENTVQLSQQIPEKSTRVIADTRAQYI